MTRPREPLELIKAKGKSNITKEFIAQRSKEEVKVDLVDVKVPEYLHDQNDIDKFNDIADKLLHIKILTELDEDCLARYVLAHKEYLKYTDMLDEFIDSRESIENISKLQSMQDKSFRQCNACARELGLTISSRCKLIAPAIQKQEEKVNKFSKFKKES